MLFKVDHEPKSKNSYRGSHGLSRYYSESENNSENNTYLSFNSNKKQEMMSQAWLSINQPVTGVIRIQMKRQ